MIRYHGGPKGRIWRVEVACERVETWKAIVVEAPAANRLRDINGSPPRNVIPAKAGTHASFNECFWWR